MSLIPFLFVLAVAIANVGTFWTVCRAFDRGRHRVPLFLLLTAGLIAIFFRSSIRFLPYGDSLLRITYLWLACILVVGMATAGGQLIRILLRHAASMTKTGLDHIQPAYFFGLGIAIGLFLLGFFRLTPMWLSILLAGLAMAGRTAVGRFLAARDVLHGDTVSGLRAGRGFDRLLLLAGLALFAFSLWEAHDVRVVRLSIPTPKIALGERYRIVAVADLHLTRQGDGPRLRRVVRLVNGQEPDLVAMLGDLVDDWLVDQDGLIASLRGIRAPERYAILGNHEVYNSQDQSAEFLRRAGFTLLRGEAVAAGPIVVAGVDDPAVTYRRTIAETVAAIGEEERFVLLLSHRPEAPGEALGHFDLQLSGHTHGGQLYPARVVTYLMFRRFQGLTRLTGAGGASGLAYLSNGAGYWGPPVRLGAPPEIVVVDLIGEG